jgi:pyruvate, water dikinase
MTATQTVPVRVVGALDGGAELSEGEVLVTHMTAPDWVPLMRRAAAIVTDSGGMTCHAAIVSRELGIPCVVGTADATKVLRAGELVTVGAGAGTVSEGDSAPRQAAVGPSQPTAVGAAPLVTGTKLLSTSPSPRSSSAQPPSTSRGAACCAPS